MNNTITTRPSDTKLRYTSSQENPKNLIRLKAWPIVQHESYSLAGIKDQDPAQFLFQLSGDIWYPVISLSDIPPTLSTHLCFKPV